MTCDRVEQALLDESFPGREGLEQHLASCADCRAFAAAHREALRLRGASLARARRRPLAEVKRRAGIVAGLVLALGGGLGLVGLEVSRHEPRPAPLNEEVFQRASPELALEAPSSQGELFALAQLQRSIFSDLARDPRHDEAAVRAFGALPAWTAPTRTQPLRSLGSAASPAFFTSEDSP